MSERGRSPSVEESQKGVREIVMGIYLDSATKSEIERVVDFPYLKGTTTNPSIIASALNRNHLSWQEMLDLIAWIAGATRGEIFVQTLSTGYDDICEEARSLCPLAPDRLVVKIPYAADGLKAVTALKSEGISTAVTAIFDPIQVYLAAEAGASYAIPYYNRMKRGGEDVSSLIPEMVRICSHGGSATTLLAASIKTPQEILEILRLGIFQMTLPFSLIRQLLDNELTARAVEDFNESLQVSRP